MEEVDNGFRLPAPLVSIDLFLPIIKAASINKGVALYVTSLPGYGSLDLRIKYNWRIRNLL
jgi:hypothetical protein